MNVWWKDRIDFDKAAAADRSHDNIYGVMFTLISFYGNVTGLDNRGGNVYNGGMN